MKKCRQCGMLSADTATVCRHCNVKFTEDDKPIVVKEKKKRSIIFTIISVAVAAIAITIFALYQSGMIRTWLQTADRNKITAITEEFVKADFEKNVEKVKSYMFDQYIEVQEQQGTFPLQNGEYVSRYFAAYSPDVSIKVSSVDIKFLEDEYQIYHSEISKKYSVDPSKIVSVEAHVQITDNEFVIGTLVPLTFVKLDKEWYIIPAI